MVSCVNELNISVKIVLIVKITTFKEAVTVLYKLGKLPKPGCGSNANATTVTLCYASSLCVSYVSYHMVLHFCFLV